MPRAPSVGSNGRGDATARRAGAVARATSDARSKPASRRAHASRLAGIVVGDVAHVGNLSCPQRNCTITGLGAYPESLRVFPPCPPCTPKHPVSSLQTLARARAVAADCAQILVVLTRLSGTAEKRSGSEAVDAVARVAATPGAQGM